MHRQNGISVEDIMNLETMGNSKLIAGARGIRNTVSRVNIMADPDILDWVQEGEFLLTTAYYLKKDNVETQKKLIEECSQRKLAGIGIKVLPYLDSLSSEVIDVANELSFPLIDIHYSTPLSDIMMDILKEVFDKQASLLARIEKVHEQLMVAMLEGNGIGDIIKIIHNNIRNPVLLSFKLSNQKYEEFGDIDEGLREELLRNSEKFYDPIDNRAKLKRLDENNVLIDGKYVTRMIMPIVLKDNVYGHIFTWSTNTPLGGFDLSILESASTTIALAVLQELSIKEVEIRYRSDFFEDLISSDTKRKSKALDRAHFFNLNHNDFYVIEVMSLKFKFEEDDNDEYLFDYLQHFTNTAVTTIEEIMNYLNLEGIVSTKLNGIQILVGFKDLDSIYGRLEELNEMIIDSLEAKSKNMNIKIGVGRAYKDLENVNKSFSDAVKTIRTGKVITNKDIMNFDELGIFKILCQAFLVEELEDFYNTTLKPLCDYDEKKSTELVKTLQTYFEHNGNLTRMSERLFTHYNTVLYRINRINQITGMDLNDPNDRLNLEIALKIKEIIE